MNIKIAPALLIIASSAFALGTKQQQVVVHGLSFDDIKAACQNPARFHNQLAPSNLQISCKDVQLKWVPDSDGTFAMGTSRNVTASLLSDKYSMEAISASLKSSDQVSACPRFKQITETLETVRAVSCDEIVAYTGSSIDFCAAAIDSLRAANKEAIATADTGAKVSLCAVINQQQAQVEQKGEAPKAEAPKAEAPKGEQAAPAQEQNQGNAQQGGAQRQGGAAEQGGAQQGGEQASYDQRGQR